jgi:glycosyltransferase involved in cell wall biosynthesis
MVNVSIIIPVYNAEKQLNRCIDSVLNQEYQDFEIIAVDDGSSDSSPEILDKYGAADKRVMVIHKKNGGVSAARNTALKQSQGKYIQFMDADDWIPADSTKLLVRDAEEKQADLVVGDFYRVVGKNVARKGSMDKDDVMTLQEYAEEMMDSPADFYYGVLWNKLYRADLIHDNDVAMDEDLNWCEDFIFNLEYLIHCRRITALQVPVYYYVKTEGSLVSQTTNPLKVIEMKMNVFSYYNGFFKDVLDEKDYRKDRLAIAGFLINGASDDNAIGIMPGTKKLGQEKISAEYTADNPSDIPAFAYCLTKLYMAELNTVALKFDLDLKDVRILAAVRSGEESSTLKSIADFTGFSSVTIAASLQKSVRKGYLTMNIESGKTYIQMGKKSGQITGDIDTALRDLRENVYRDFTEDEVKSTDKAIQKITANLKRIL